MELRVPICLLRQLPFHIAASVFCFDAFAFVEEFLASRQCDVDFGVSFWIDVEKGRYYGIAAFFDFVLQFA